MRKIHVGSSWAIQRHFCPLHPCFGRVSLGGRRESVLVCHDNPGKIVSAGAQNQRAWHGGGLFDLDVKAMRWKFLRCMG